MITAAALLVLARALPPEAAVGLCRCLVLAYLLLRPDYRAECGRNYRLVTGRRPGLFWIRNAWTVGRNLALMARLGTRSAETMVDRATVSSQNQAVTPLEQNLHTTMATYHFGLWELLPGWFARAGRPVQLVVGRQRGAAFAGLLARLRGRAGVAVEPGLRAARTRREGPGITGFMLDNTSQGGEAWAAVGGLRLRMPALAFRFGQGILQTAFARLDRGRLHIDVYRAGNENEAAAALLEQVRAHPEEWVFWAKDGAVQEIAD
ncbi:MAG: hypothetical protein R6X13_11840 [bacterium]